MIRFEHILALIITGAIAYALSKIYRKKLKVWQHILITIALLLAGYSAYNVLAVGLFLLTRGIPYF